MDPQITESALTLLHQEHQFSRHRILHTAKEMLSGTSMASAQVSCTAALVWKQCPTFLTADEVKDRIVSNCASSRLSNTGVDSPHILVNVAMLFVAFDAVGHMGTQDAQMSAILVVTAEITVRTDARDCQHLELANDCSVSRCGQEHDEAVLRRSDLQ